MYSILQRRTIPITVFDHLSHKSWRIPMWLGIRPCHFRVAFLWAIWDYCYLSLSQYWWDDIIYWLWMLHRVRNYLFSWWPKYNGEFQWSVSIVFSRRRICIRYLLVFHILSIFWVLIRVKYPEGLILFEEQRVSVKINLC